MENKLKPCPFCGANATIAKSERTFYAMCLNCCVEKYPDNDEIWDKNQAISVWNTRRPAEKLVPLDKVKIYHLIKKYFLMIPGDDRPTNILQDTALDDACDEICARFGTTEKLVPINQDELANLAMKFRMPINKDAKSMTNTVFLIEAICKRFASVPVVPVVEWPPHKECRCRDDARCDCGATDRNFMLRLCKAAHAKAQKVDVGKLVEALESIVNHKQTTVEPTAEGFQRIAKQALEQAKR